MGRQEYIDTVSLVGRKVEEFVAFNAIAVADTSAKFSTIVDVSKYKKIIIEYYSTLNNATNDVNPIMAVYDDSYKAVKTHSGTTSIPLNARSALVQITGTDFSSLNSIYTKIRLQIAVGKVPDSGSITVKIKGVVN
jgi:hypothetical protein